MVYKGLRQVLKLDKQRNPNSTKQTITVIENDVSDDVVGSNNYVITHYDVSGDVNRNNDVISNNRKGTKISGQSTDRKDDRKPEMRNQLLGGGACAMIHLSVGAMFGYTATTLPGMMASTPDDPFAITRTEAAVVASSLSIGALVGSISSSPLLFYLGQRRLLLICLPLLLVSWVVMSQAYAFWLIAFSRFAQGIMNGILSGATTTYVIEISHPSSRGRMYGLVDLNRQVGFVFSYLVGSSSLTWREVALVCGIVLPVVPFVIMVGMVDSPRWLASRERYDEVDKSLKFFRGKHYDTTVELNDILNKVNSQKKQLTMVEQFKLLHNRALAIVFVVILLSNFLFHCTGSMAISTYSAVIFKAATDQVDPYLSTVVAGIGRVCGSSVYLMLADTAGRRIMFLIPHTISLAFIALLGFYFYLLEHLHDISQLSYMPLICALMYNFFFSISGPPIQSLYTELLPTAFRSFGTGLYFMCFFLGAFTVMMTFMKMIDTIGFAWTFWTYALLGLVSFLLVLVYLPETQGKSLEDIHDLLQKKRKQRKQSTAIGAPVTDPNSIYIDDRLAIRRHSQLDVYLKTQRKSLIDIETQLDEIEEVEEEEEGSTDL